jgi:ribose transport system permease protein
MKSEGGKATAERAWTRELADRIREVDLRDYGIVVAFVALFTTFSVTASTFLERQNMANILDQYAAIGLVTIGETLCIIAGVFDLSAAAIVSVSGVVSAKAANATNPGFGLFLGVMAGVGLGIANGLIIFLTRINSFIGTLATSIVYGGLAIIITGGNIVTVTDPDFGLIGQREAFGIKYTGWTFIGFAVIAAFVLARTTFGRYVYAVGGNAEAARLSGIRVGLIRGGCFAISGLAAGLAGILLTSRVQAAQADIGGNIALTAIAAAVVGGTSILGGEGAVWRGVLGVLLIAIIGNGFNLLDISTTYQQIVYGGLILIAVAADQLLRRRP